jgi:hypothetical protein
MKPNALRNEKRPIYFALLVLVAAMIVILPTTTSVRLADKATRSIAPSTVASAERINSAADAANTCVYPLMQCAQTNGQVGAQQGQPTTLTYPFLVTVTQTSTQSANTPQVPESNVTSWGSVCGPPTFYCAKFFG